MRQTAEAVDLAWSAGLPVPRHEVVTALADGSVAVVQERLPGRHLDRLDAAAVDALVEMNDRFAGLLAGRSDIPTPDAFPTAGGGDQWVGTLGAYSDRTRCVLDHLNESDDEPYLMVGDDLIHTDYSFGNVLFDQRRAISGIVDWNFGVDRGDRRFALLGLRGYLCGDGWDVSGRREALSRLDAALADRLEPDLLQLYMAHRAVHAVHVSIRDFSHRPDRVERDLRGAEQLLGLWSGDDSGRHGGRC